MARTEVRGGQILDASVSLSADITGTLAVGNGGTGRTDGALLFSPMATQSYLRGLLYYDTDNESLTFHNDTSAVSLQIGQELWVRVRNVSGSTIANGVPVYIDGSNSGLPTIALCNSGAAMATVALGLTTQAITNSSNGFVCVMGEVKGLDTSAFTAGASVFLGATLGSMSTTAPSAPSYRYRVGKVTISDASVGRIHVTPSTASIGTGTANQLRYVTTTGIEGYRDLDRSVVVNAPGATPSINIDVTDVAAFTGINAAITSMTTNWTGTPTNGQKLMIRFKDDGTPRAITWGASFQSSGVATLLATTIASKTHHVGLIYDSAVAKWVCIATDVAGY